MGNFLHTDRLMRWEDRVATILLVEDEDFVRNVTREILRAAGYRVLVAGDSAAAARRYDEFRAEVDLLLTDMILPGENGAELAARMRQQNPELQVLFVTGYADQIAVLKEADEEYLLKPFCAEDLVNKVSELMAKPGTQEEESFMRACVGA